MENNICDLKTRKAGQREDRKALGINREELAVGAAESSILLQQTLQEGTAEPSSWHLLILSRFAQILLEAEKS